MEVIHVADRGGRRCIGCGKPIAHHEAPPYNEGEPVVVLDEDPCASWRTARMVNCTALATFDRSVSWGYLNG